MPEDIKKERTERSEAGFTLMELIIVVVILGLLAAVLAPQLADRMMRSKSTVAKIGISQIEGAIQLFSLDMGRVPTNAEGLQALTQNPTGANSWDGPYLEKGLPPDPWGAPYVYKSPGDHGEFDICSNGPDGVAGTEDDICNRE